ncbi:unnamed protein product [Calicophoron daubneyi]|uniref:RING-type domain-containing protein n=1 Tax=Calicophoron daubneyi TaxID=300641 RepID=A0AAV2T1V1_CALDB
MFEAPDSVMTNMAPENDPILHPAPGVSRPMSQLTEEEQVRIATRMGLISTLPLFTFDEDKREKMSECIICMCDYEVGEELRTLPCLHTYHRVCIDDWLMRSLTCPSCLEELRPASPPIVRSTGNDNEGNTQPPSNPPEPQRVSSDTPPSYTTAESDAAARQRQKRGDSLNALISSDLAEHRTSEPPSISETVQPSRKSSKPSGQSNANNNGSGGDCSQIIVGPHVNAHPRIRHRRTRSNGIGSTPHSESLIGSTPPRLEQYRRGNSTTEVELAPPIPPLSINSTQSRPPIERNPTNISGVSNTVQQIFSSRQVDGDSHELHPA